MDTRSRSAARRSFRIARWSVLGLVLVAGTAFSLAHQKLPALRLIAVDGLCPFGGIESLWSLLSSGGMLQRIEVASFVLLAAAVLGALVFRRAFCGLFCPLGTLQELVTVLRTKLGIRRREMPSLLDRPARLLKYAVLVLVAIWTWRVGELVIRPYDPWAAWNHLSSDELLTGYGVGLGILAVSLAGSFFYDRFFCKYACPMGAFLAPLSRLGFFRMERNASACIDCGLCDKACTMNCAVSSADGVVNDSECISCGECVAACPKPEALAVKGRSGVRINPAVLVGAATALFVAVIGVSTALGDMRFTKPSLAEQLESGTWSAREGGSGRGDEHAEGADEAGAVPVAPGAFDTSLIKGYMTMAEVAEATGIGLDRIAATFNVPAEATDEPMKEIKDTYGFSVEDVRAFVVQETTP